MKLPANYAEFSDKAQRRNRWQTLTQLVHHPLVSAAQLAALRRIPLKTLNWHLKRLIADGWVYRVSYRPPVRTPHPTFLYALTPKALEFLCPPEFASWSAYAHARDCQLPRLERLLLSMERVVCVRDWLLAPFWRKSEWSIRRWDEEVQLPYREYDRPFHPEQHAPQTVSLHGAALLRGRARTPRQGQWTWLAIEVDWGGLPVRLHRERWEHFLRAQGDERFLGRAQQGHFPPLLVIADTHARLVEYGNALIDSATKRRGGRDLIPWVYLTQASSLARLHKDAQAPVWYSLRHGEWVAFLEDFQGALDEPQVYWVRLPAPTARPSPRVRLPTHEQAAVLAGSNAKGLSRNGVRAFAYLTLVLRSTDKRILNELGHHPLLTDRELAFQLHASLHDVRGALARLQEHGLVTRHTPPPQRTPWPRRRPDVRAAYTLADRGVRFHSAVDGFGREVNRYVHARGWGWHGREDGWSRRLPKPATAARSHTDWGLVFASAVLYWDHTRAENEIMLQFAWTAWQHGDSLVWLAEQEGRLEYDAPIALSDDPRMHGSHPNRTAGGRRSRRLGPIYLLRRPYFLPDARGEYITVEERFPFALEVDRSYNRDAALWDKFRRYAVALEKKTGDYQGYRLLLVTTGWRHAERLVRLARQLFGFSFDRDEASSEEEANARLARHMLPLFVTTFRAVHSQSASGPIWWNAVSNRRDEYCFPGLAETMESGKGEGEEGREREGRKK